MEGSGTLRRLPLGQRVAHVPPKRGLSIRDLGGERLVGAGDGLPKVNAGISVPSLPPVRGRLGERWRRTSRGRPSDARAPPRSPSVHGQGRRPGRRRPCPDERRSLRSQLDALEHAEIGGRAATRQATRLDSLSVLKLSAIVVACKKEEACSPPRHRLRPPYVLRSSVAKRSSPSARRLSRGGTRPDSS